MYSRHCGLANVTMSWGHTEYLWLVLQGNGCTLPEQVAQWCGAWAMQLASVCISSTCTVVLACSSYGPPAKVLKGWSMPNMHGMGLRMPQEGP